MTRLKGGKVSLTAFEAHWLTTVLETINPIEIDALEYVKIPVPQGVADDPGAAWEKIMTKLGNITPGTEPE